MVSERTREIKPFIVMDVLEKAHTMARDGVDVVHLEVGEPDFDTPACVKAAAIHALEAGHTHYTHSLGLIELRQAICRHYKDRYDVTVEPDQVVVTSGTSPAMFMLFAVLLEQGDRVSRLPYPFTKTTDFSIDRRRSRRSLMTGPGRCSLIHPPIRPGPCFPGNG